MYAKCKFIAQCFIYGNIHDFILIVLVPINCGDMFSEFVDLDAGDSFNSFLVAIVAVEPDVLKAWAASQGIQVSTLTFHFPLPYKTKHWDELIVSTQIRLRASLDCIIS